MDNLEQVMEMEGDKREFFYDGYFCLALRGPIKALCGYVGIPQKIIDRNVDYDYERVPCHGGVTFTGGFKEYPDLFLIGFDCSHHGDLIPDYRKPTYGAFGGESTYRDMYYVQDELEGMVDFLRKDLIDGKRISQKDYPDSMQGIDI